MEPAFGGFRWGLLHSKHRSQVSCLVHGWHQVAKGTTQISPTILQHADLRIWGECQSLVIELQCRASNLHEWRTDLAKALLLGQECEWRVEFTIRQQKQGVCWIPQECECGYFQKLGHTATHRVPSTKNLVQVWVSFGKIAADSVRVSREKQQTKESDLSRESARHQVTECEAARDPNQSARISPRSKWTFDSWIIQGQRQSYGVYEARCP